MNSYPLLSSLPLISLSFFIETATTEIYTLSLHDALPILALVAEDRRVLRIGSHRVFPVLGQQRSEEHTSELQSLRHLVCRLLLEKKNHRLKSLALSLAPNR